jgi:hypothetical protein
LIESRALILEYLFQILLIAQSYSITSYAQALKRRARGDALGRPLWSPALNQRCERVWDSRFNDGINLE